MNLLTMKQTSKKIGFSVATIYNWINQGKFPAPRKFGYASRWIDEYIEMWIHKNEPYNH